MDIVLFILTKIRECDLKEITIDFVNVSTRIENSDVYNMILEYSKYP